MNIIKYLFFIFLLNESAAFNNICMSLNNKFVSRKAAINVISLGTIASVKSVTNIKEVLAEEENKPLTPAEMEEYNRLLKEAKKIQSIIDANKKSLLDEENGIEKYLKEKGLNITKK